MSQGWHYAFGVTYRLLGWLDGPIRAVWRREGIGNVVELRVVGRRSGRQRSVLVGLLRVADRSYLGHPDGESAWTLNLAAAGEGSLLMRGLPPLDFQPTRLPPGPERDAVIGATGQHPFPANVMYRAGRAHVRATGVYFRVDPVA